ncbi:MAG: insulinase family protein, partial [Pseudomonadota bacterium]
MNIRHAAASLAALSVAIAAPMTPALADDHAAAATETSNSLQELVAQVQVPFEKFELENGLTVVVHEDRKAPIVGVAVWYNVGSKDEPQGLTGFAHLFEHLMFNGSENAPNDYFQYLQEMGATDYNGTTNFDRTNYFQTVPRPALERALWLESDRMGYLLGAVTQGKLDNQIGVVGAVFVAEPVLHILQRCCFDVCHRANDRVLVRVAIREDGFKDFVENKAAGTVVALTLLVLDNADLVVELALRDRTNYFQTVPRPA